MTNTPQQTPKTYAIQMKDFLGITYTLGYVNARTEQEALEEARRIHHDKATVQVVNTDAEMARILDGLMQGKNEQTNKEGK